MRFDRALLCLCAASCASTGVDSHPANPEIQREIAEVVKAVRVDTGNALLADLRRLVAYDIFAIEPVSKLAADPNARVRSNAMWVLAQIQDPEQRALMAKIDDVLHRGLDDGDSTVRFEAAAGLAARGSWDVLPILIDGLDDRDSGVRYRCHQQLVATTSRDFGFSADAPDEARRDAANRWREWYAQWKKSRS